MTSEQDGRETVARILAKAKIATLTTVDLEGNLVSRPLQLQQTDADGNLWFFTPDPSPKADEIRANANVNVAVNDSAGFLSIAGTGTLTKDQQKIDELWKTSVEGWFENGREDPAVALLMVNPHTAEYWASDEPGIVSMFKVGKAAVTGGTPDVGKNDVVNL